MADSNKEGTMRMALHARIRVPVSVVALLTTFAVVGAFVMPAAASERDAGFEQETALARDVTIEAEATRLAAPIKDGDFELPDIRPNTHDEEGMNIVWTNRGPGDGFGAVFGAGLAADAARANVDAAIDAWESVITSLNRPGTPGDDTINVTVNMNAGATATSCGGSANGNFDGDGWPTGGTINLNGNAGVWFIDPTPTEHSEFMGNIDNAFSGDAPAGSPAAGLCDIYTVVVAEGLHILGITSDGGSRFQTAGFNTQLTATGTTCSGPGDLWQFTGPNITALMTSNNGGLAANGGSDFGVPVHTAEPCASNGGLTGANDGGNALFEGGRRYLPSNNTALILADAFNFSIVAPERFATFYSVLNRTTGNLTVRGSDDAAASDDVISVTRSGDAIVSSVDIENDIAGTGPTDAFVTRFDEGEVLSVNADGDNGADAISLGANLGIPVTVTGGPGSDTIIGTDGPDTIDGEGGADTIDGRGGADTLDGGDQGDTIDGGSGGDTITGGSGDDTLLAGTGANVVSDGSGNDVVDLSQNAVGVSYVTGGGDDTVIGSPHDDQLTGSAGVDRLVGRAGDDTLIGAGADDELFGSSGSDTFVWTPGDGSDLVEGGSGENDTIAVTTGGGGDLLRIRNGAGSRMELRRTNGTAFTIDTADIEAVDLDAGAGADEIRVNDISDTSVRSVDVRGGAAADELIVRGSGGDDRLQASLGDSGIEIAGMAYGVSFVDAELADDVTLDARAGEDDVVVHGSDGADTLTAASLGRYSATVTGGVPVTVNVERAEKLVIDGNDGDDSLTIESPVGSDKVKLSPFEAIDEGKVKVKRRIPIVFRDLGNSGQIELTTGGGGRADTLIYRGTSEDDRFVVDATSIALNDRIAVLPTGVDVVKLKSGADDDTFELQATLPYATTKLFGGSSTAGDEVQLTGAAGAVEFSSGPRTITGYGGTVKLKGVEQVDSEQTGGAGTDVSVRGSSADNNIAYAPASASSGSVDVDGKIVFSFSGADGVLSIDALGGDDDVSVHGTLGDDDIVVDAAPVTAVQVGTSKEAMIPLATAEVISIHSGEGEDLIDVTVYDGADAVLTVQGDLDVAKKFSDEMIVRNGSATKVTYHDVKSHVKESGSVFAEYKGTGSETRIDYVDVEGLTFIK